MNPIGALLFSILEVLPPKPTRLSSLNIVGDDGRWQHRWLNSVILRKAHSSGLGVAWWSLFNIITSLWCICLKVASCSSTVLSLAVFQLWKWSAHVGPPSSFWEGATLDFFPYSYKQRARGRTEVCLAERKPLMPATSFILWTQQRGVLRKNLIPNGKPCKSHRRNPAEVTHVSVGKAHTSYLWIPKLPYLWTWAH